MDRENFKRKLKNIGITQKEFANFTGCAYSTVKNWENTPKWVDILLNYMEIFHELHNIESILHALSKFKKEINIIKNYKV